MFKLTPLPYAESALAPVISEKTLEFHHGKHHAAYVKTLNELLEKKGAKPESLEEVIVEAGRSRDAKLFNNAAQAWNHAFFWTCMSPDRQRPEALLDGMIAESFGDLAKLRDAFVTEGVGHFGSGWVWLAAKEGGRKLVVLSTHDADDTIPRPELTPLLVCDVWEHAYYLNHQNDRKGFLEAWFDALPNWSFAADQLRAARGESEAWRHPSPA
jgi:Fe-Mn family superoxide dismutase